MVKNIINNTAFRILTPIFYGVTMYILILLIFDRVQQLSENFLLVEVILCVGTTYLLFELIRWYILFVERYCSKECPVSKRIIIQGSGSILISLLVTSLIIYFYFSKLVGFNTFRNELTVFNSIFLISGILYNMVYFSFFYLNKTNVTQLEKEYILRKSVEIELDTYKNKINPDFLYDSLETLLSLSKKDVELADKFIHQLSEVYRNILSSKNSELVSISDEFEILQVLVDIFNYKLGNNLKISDFNKNKISSYRIISGTLVVIAEDIVNRTIISEIEPLNIEFKIEDESLKLIHPVRNKLIQVFSKKTELEQLKKAYLFQSNRELSVNEISSKRIYSIPLLNIE